MCLPESHNARLVQICKSSIGYAHLVRSIRARVGKYPYVYRKKEVSDILTSQKNEYTY